MKRTNIKKKKDASILFKKSGQKANKRMKNLRHSLYSRSSLCVFSLRSIHQPCVNPVSPPPFARVLSTRHNHSSCLGCHVHGETALAEPKAGQWGGEKSLGCHVQATMACWGSHCPWIYCVRYAPSRQPGLLKLSLVAVQRNENILSWPSLLTGTIFPEG